MCVYVSSFSSVYVLLIIEEEENFQKLCIYNNKENLCISSYCEIKPKRVKRVEEKLPQIEKRSAYQWGRNVIQLKLLLAIYLQLRLKLGIVIQKVSRCCKFFV